MRHPLRFIVFFMTIFLLTPAVITRAETPSEISQGLPTADAASQGMDVTRLTAAHQAIRTGLPHVHSLLVVRHGYLVWEKYYGRYNRNTRHAVMSVTKSVTSALVGIASDSGLIHIDAQVVSYLPEYFPPEVDGRKLAIQVRHLLMLRSGLDWAEYPPLSREAQQVTGSVGYVLGLPMIASPGDNWRYSTGDYHILSGILTRVTGMTELAFADSALFGPLGIGNRHWQTDFNGLNTGGVGLSLTPRDMAKFGLLYLRGGAWNGQPVVSYGWVQLTTEPQPGNPPQAGQPGYGYGWWITDLHWQRVYFAAGYGGQLIAIIPALDMVVVMTGDETVSPPVHDNNMYRSLQIVENYVIPAAR